MQPAEHLSFIIFYNLSDLNSRIISRNHTPLHALWIILINIQVRLGLGAQIRAQQTFNCRLQDNKAPWQQPTLQMWCKFSSQYLQSAARLMNPVGTCQPRSEGSRKIKASRTRRRSCSAAMPPTGARSHDQNKTRRVIRSFKWCEICTHAPQHSHLADASA